MVGTDYKPAGFYLPAFLRKIGADNASLITTIKIQLGGFRLSTKVLPIYVETLIQHVKGLSKVILGKHSHLRHTYVSKKEKKEKKEKIKNRKTHG